MNILIKRILILITLITLFSCGAPGKPNNTIVSVKTTLGEIKLILYDDTPLHRNNFITLINSGLYDNVSFHRVIKDFMIQTGDLSTRPAGSSAAPDSLSGYTIPAEINRQHFHKKGALAAARQGNEVNPEMRSSGTQFYIVQGTRYNDQDLNMAEQKINSNIKQSVFNRFIHQISDSLKTSGVPATDAQIQDLASMKMFEYLTTSGEYKLTEDERTIYKTLGGVPRLDGTYTVFGEVIEGLDIVDKIAAVPTGTNDRPLNDIRILKIKITQ